MLAYGRRTVEAIKDAANVLGGNADTGVAHGNENIRTPTGGI
jgi:hypothetical protein